MACEKNTKHGEQNLLYIAICSPEVRYSVTIERQKPPFYRFCFPTHLDVLRVFACAGGRQ